MAKPILQELRKAFRSSGLLVDTCYSGQCLKDISDDPKLSASCSYDQTGTCLPDGLSVSGSTTTVFLAKLLCDAANNCHFFSKNLGSKENPDFIDNNEDGLISGEEINAYLTKKFGPNYRDHESLYGLPEDEKVLEQRCKSLPGKPKILVDPYKGFIFSGPSTIKAKVNATETESAQKDLLIPIPNFPGYPLKNDEADLEQWTKKYSGIEEQFKNYVVHKLRVREKELRLPPNEEWLIRIVPPKSGEPVGKIECAGKKTRAEVTIQFSQKPSVKESEIKQVTCFYNQRPTITHFGFLSQEDKQKVRSLGSLHVDETFFPCFGKDFQIKCLKK